MSNPFLRKSRIIAPIGLSLVGAGLCVFGEALTLKANEVNFWTWFFWGTGGLVFINAGISIFGKAVVYRSLYERSKTE